MAINPITFANRVNRQFLRYQLSAFPLSDESIAEQAHRQIVGEDGASPLIKGPYISLSRAYQMGPTIEALIDEGLLHPAMQGIAPFPQVFQHQHEALQAVHAGNHVIVSTGTGSGKTEAFLYPILNDCLQLRDQSAPEGLLAVVVYPMNALAADQLQRLRDMLAGTGITFGMYVGSTPADESNLVDQVRPKGDSREAYEKHKVEITRRGSTEVVCPFEERVTESEMEASPPRILLTNHHQLELLLTRGKDLGMFIDAPLKYLVFDEAHTYSGVRGAEVSLLIRRLRAFVGKSADEVTCFGSSATIYDPEDPEAGKNFAARFFGVDREKITLVEETHQEQEWGRSLYTQPPFTGDGEELLGEVVAALETGDPAPIASVATRLTGFEFNLTGNWPEELYDHFRTSKYVKLLFDKLQEPTHIDEAAALITEALDREESDLEASKAELLAILAFCGVAIKGGDPLLKPKLHFFVQGLQGAIATLSSNADGATRVNFYMSLEKALAGHPDYLPQAFYPVSTCRVCGQHVLTTHLQNMSIERRRPHGGSAEGDNVYWLPGFEGEGTRVQFTDRFIIEGEDIDEDVERRLEARRIHMHACPYCGTFHQHQGNVCANERCARSVDLLPVSIILGTKAGEVLVGCPSCKTNPFQLHGTPREPFRALRAVAVADVHILSQDLLNAGRGEQERLIVFSDNRQDAAFQAGWMQDHARRFRLRNLIHTFLRGQSGPISITDVENSLLRLYDTDRPLIQALCPEVFHARTPEFFGTSLQDTLAKYLRIQLLMEFNTPYSHARSLETWGLVKVVYAYVDPEEDQFRTWSEKYGIDPAELTDGVATLLNIWRRNARILYDDREPIYSHYWHPSDKEVANGFLPHMDFPPKGLKLTRTGNDNKAYVMQVISSGGVTAAMDFTKCWGLSAKESGDFLEELWDWLVAKGIIRQVQLAGNKGRPLPRCSGTYQIGTHAIGYIAQYERYRCNTCHRYHTTDTPNHACSTYRCKGNLTASPIDEEDYDISTLLQPFAMVMAQEHSAQVTSKVRDQIEREFKSPSGRVNTLVATPTLELGVDIGDLDIILLRNVPPRSSNYWQRVGRAGRRLHMAVLYTYCRNSKHDRYFFEDPYRLLRSPVSPPRFNLQNGVMIRKHVHAAVLSNLIKTLEEMPEEFPPFIDGYLFDDNRNYRVEPMNVGSYGVSIQDKRDALLESLIEVFSQYWPEDASSEVIPDVLGAYLEEAGSELQQVVNRLFRRMAWTRRTIDKLTGIMRKRNLDSGEKKLLARCRTYLESLEAHTLNSYTLTVLASNGFLPGYGVYTGNISGYAERFKTTTGQSIVDFELTRPPSISIREFVPGNLIYANSGKFQVDLYHLPLDQALVVGDRYIVNPETEVICAASESTGYADPNAGSLPAIAISDVDLGYVSRISDAEPARFMLPVQIMGIRQQTHRGGKSYTIGRNTTCHHMRGQEVRLINVGPSEQVRARNFGFWICTVCGGVRSPFAVQAVIDQFQKFHREKCGREPERTGLYADVTVDGFLFKKLEGKDKAVNLGEVLKKAAAEVIEMDVEDLQILILPQSESEFDLFLYDPMPGGSGLLQQILDRWGEVREAGLELSRECPSHCETSCYECLRTYRNVFYHDLLDRQTAASILEDLESIEFDHDIPENIAASEQEGQDTLASEAKLGDMLVEAGFPAPTRQKSLPITVEGFPEIQQTTPDFVYEDQKVTIYLDGMSGHIHGNPETQLRDRLITDALEESGWTVIRIQYPELGDKTVMGLYFKKLARALELDE